MEFTVCVGVIVSGWQNRITMGCPKMDWARTEGFTSLPSDAMRVHESTSC